MAGLIFVNVAHRYNSGYTLKLCNPYKRAFVDIPVPHTRLYSECIVVNESSNHKSDVVYKVVALRDNWSVQIYEPSQEGWNIAGYFPDDYKMDINTPLVHCNGSFYGQCQWRADEVNGIACFNIRLHEGPKAIPVLFAPYPEIVRNYHLLSWIITCGSCLLLIARGWVHVEVEGHVDTEQETIIWEFRNEDLKSASWKWVEIARTPYLLCKEWRNKLSTEHPLESLWFSCTGVGDHVCFTPSLHWIQKTETVSLVAYNFINNTWDFLPSCPSAGCVGAGEGYYNTIPLVPSLHRKML